MSELTYEEAKQIRIVKEYRVLVTAKRNDLGLCGYQPTLNKVRTAYQANEITESDLDIVLNSLAQSLQGESEAFKSKKHALEYMFGKQLKRAAAQPTLSPVVLSAIEQCAVVKDLMPKKKAYTGPRRKKEKKVETINVSALPAHLQHLAK